MSCSPAPVAQPMELATNRQQRCPVIPWAETIPVHDIFANIMLIPEYLAPRSEPGKSIHLQSRYCGLLNRIVSGFNATILISTVPSTVSPPEPSVFAEGCISPTIRLFVTTGKIDTVGTYCEFQGFCWRKIGTSPTASGAIAKRGKV